MLDRLIWKVKNNNSFYLLYFWPATCLYGWTLDLTDWNVFRMDIHVGGHQRMNPTDPPAFSSSPHKLNFFLLFDEMSQQPLDEIPKKMIANFLDDQ